ncbi:MAG TPA: hypothetical protein VHV55_18725 [Pirellulales bacterium]|nr:hypothetical protein [Pirellulales bacterium]
MTTNREKVLVLVFPAILILGVYGLKLSGIRTRLTAATASLESAKKSVPAPAAVQAEQIRIADLNRQLADVEKQTADWDQQWHELQATRAVDSHARIEAIEGLTALLNRNRLDLQEGGPAEANESARLPKELDEVIKLLAEKKTEVRPQLWRVRFTGRYADVLDALEELQTAEPLAVPVHLQMTNASLETDQRSWTLYLWI